MKKKLLRISTVSISLESLLKGQLAYLNQYYEVVGVASGKEELQVVEEREGINTIEINMHRQINLWADLKALVQLYLLFRKEKPQIVHSITPKAGLLSMAAAYFAKVPIRIHTFTGLVFPSKTGAMQKILIFMDRVLCFFATSVYPEGQGVKNDLINYKITRKPLKIIGNGNVNGIDVNYFKPELFNLTDKQNFRTENGINPENFVFVFVGRLVGDKGINELVKAFQKIATQVKRAKLLLVGPLESDLDPLQAHTLIEIVQNRSIISIGFQKDVRPYLAISNALVFPSYREGFPNVVMQAGAMGLPSIVTNINGCNEIIQDNVNGIIIPPKDCTALENAMIELLEKGEKRERLAQNARPLIVERYEQQLVWRLIKQEYDEQLAKADA